jgi:hypothetical protein
MVEKPKKFNVFPQIADTGIGYAYRMIAVQHYREVKKREKKRSNGERLKTK